MAMTRRSEILEMPAAPPPPATLAPADLFTVCNRAPWLEQPTELRFLLAGIVAYTHRLRALILDAPFTHVKDDVVELPPPPDEFPPAIDAARIFACPMRKTRRAITLLPRAIRYVSGQSRHFYIETAGGSFEDYLLKFSSRSRSTLKRKVKKFCAASGAAQPLREFSHPGQMEEFHRLATQVSATTYQHRLLDAGLPTSFAYRRALMEEARWRRVRGYILMHGKQPAAYLLARSTGATFTFGKTGFDPQFAAVHPGAVLMLLTIQRVFGERRFRLIDFGCGDYDYKEFLSTGNTWCGDILYLRRTTRNLAVVLLHRAHNAATDGAKKILDLVGCKARLKKFIHYGMPFVS